ncbi:recombinase family protein [Devosia sp. MC532]|uniref:recombinase family protein n=1 Tax=Devosia sp. MC532 TaxID=2799788 RepID=UPI0018F6962A|nr:recombinase family protein [Devosia sp. MC532]MBJ7579307.1 recombinase family protein [Devosia sp. MC532]
MGSNIADGSPSHKKAVIYCRVSSLAQVRKGEGLSSQEATCRDFAKHNGYVVEAVFADNITGGSKDRVGIDALLAHLKAHRREVRFVIVDHMDRFSRDVRGYWDLRDLLEAAGGKLVCTRMALGNKPSDTLVQNILMSAAQYQRQDNAVQTLNRMKGVC